MDKENVVYTYNGILALKGRKSTISTWMDLEGIMLNEISQSQKDKY